MAAAARPYPGEAVSGDAWYAGAYRDGFLFAMIDGAGHGLMAAESAQVVTEVLSQPASLDLDEYVAHCHRRLRGMRGAVLTLAALDLEAGLLSVAGVGNAEAYLRMAGREQRITPQRGILGSVMPRVRRMEFALSGDWTFAMHTDGLRTRFTLGDRQPQERTQPGLDEMAMALLTEFERRDDDATVMLVTPAHQPRTASPC